MQRSREPGAGPALGPAWGWNSGSGWGPTEVDRPARGGLVGTSGTHVATSHPAPGQPLPSTLSPSTPFDCYNRQFVTTEGALKRTKGGTLQPRLCLSQSTVNFRAKNIKCPPPMRQKIYVQPPDTRHSKKFSEEVHKALNQEGLL